MSLGLHRIWKKDLIKKIKKEKAEVILDLAGGTGDISIYLAKYFSNRRRRPTSISSPRLVEWSL